MIGYLLLAAGLVSLVVGVALLLGPWVFIGAGVVAVVLGLFVDFDRVKEPQRAKRHPAAP